MSKSEASTDLSAALLAAGIKRAALAQAQRASITLPLAVIALTGYRPGEVQFGVDLTLEGGALRVLNETCCDRRPIRKQSAHSLQREI